MDRVFAVVVDESKWLTASMSLALLAVAVVLHGRREAGLPRRRLALAGMNLFFGVTIGTMAAGHLLAVTARLASGTLEGSVPLLYLIGVAVAVPSWWLTRHTWTLLEPGDGHGRMTVRLNAWLVATLVVLGLHNLPLALPGLLNIGYHLHSRRWVGAALLGAALVVNGALFVGSVVFFASGQSFEEFSQ